MTLHFFSYFRRSVLELQFENVQLNLESRPRSGSQRISVSLGGIYVWDRLTKDTVFPVLVAPQGHDSAPSALAGRGPRAFPPGLQRLRSQGSGSMGPTSTPNTARRSSQIEEALFELVYEMKPFNSTSDYRLVSVYFHKKINCIVCFFNLNFPILLNFLFLFQTAHTITIFRCSLQPSCCRMVDKLLHSTIPAA